MLVNQVLPTLSTTNGMTELAPRQRMEYNASPFHSRRMGSLFFILKGAPPFVTSFYGRTRRNSSYLDANDQAVLSRMVNSLCCSNSNYTFIWGMGGENLDYSDQDFFTDFEITLGP